MLGLLLESPVDLTVVTTASDPIPLVHNQSHNQESEAMTMTDEATTEFDEFGDERNWDWDFEGGREPFLIREGSSLRNQEELDLLFITDVRDIAACYGDEEQQAEAVQNLYDATVIVNKSCICCNEELPSIVEDAEDLLVALGFSVEFNDGYVIYEGEA